MIPLSSDPYCGPTLENIGACARRPSLPSPAHLLAVIFCPLQRRAVAGCCRHWYCAHSHYCGHSYCICHCCQHPRHWGRCTCAAICVCLLLHQRCSLILIPMSCVVMLLKHLGCGCGVLPSRALLVDILLHRHYIF